VLILGRVLLVVALLAGWQAALEHPIEHVDEAGGFVHLHSGHSHDQGSDGGLLCDALAALTACAAQAQVFPASENPIHRVASYPLDAQRPAPAPPFLSQGPPIAPV
jgi:hypothetical protein